jgi:hypothetical protein
MDSPVAQFTAAGTARPRKRDAVSLRTDDMAERKGSGKWWRWPILVLVMVGLVPIGVLWVALWYLVSRLLVAFIALVGDDLPHMRNRREDRAGASVVRSMDEDRD